MYNKHEKQIFKEESVMLTYEIKCVLFYEYKGKRIWWIVYTGGPCSGKTTSLSKVKRVLTNEGYKVFMIDEAATRTINSGLSSQELGNYAFQEAIAEMQLSTEAIIEKAIKRYVELPNSKDNIVVIADRGLIDGKAYMDTDEAFTRLLGSFGLTENEAKARYSGVIHLVTAADGAEEYYTLENNSARSESPEEARAIDKKTFASWSGHKHISIIDNSTNFEKKIDRVLQETHRLLGAPIPIDSFRKYLVSMPNFDALSKDFYCKFSKVEIVRSYLLNTSDVVEKSVIRTGSDGDYAYYYIEKRHFDGHDQIDVERHITKNEYLEILSGPGARVKEIKKTRYGFVWDNKYYEVDVFDFWKDRAILKVQLTDRSTDAKIPPIFNVRMDITNDMSYTNYSLAQNVF